MAKLFGGFMSIIEKTDREWQDILSPLAYKVTRKHGTERAFSHDDFPKEEGYFPNAPLN